MDMKNQLSLDITICRAQFLLDKLNGSSLPFTESINVVEMKESLLKIQEALTVVDDWTLVDPRGGSYAKKLKKVVYEAEDLLDEYLTVETEIPDSIKKMKEGSNKSRSFMARLSDQAAAEMPGMKENSEILATTQLLSITNIGHSMRSSSSYSADSRLEIVTEKLGSLIGKMVRVLGQGMGSGVMKRAGKSEEEESQIIQSFPDKIELAEQVFGREVEKKEIVQLLINKNERDLLAIPILGEDGIGKTTLARLAFNDERVQTHFELKLWIPMRSNFNVLTVIREVIKGVTGSNCDILDEGELQRCVHGALGGTLFLLVLDDVQKTWVINSLTNFLSCVGSGSRILITAPSLGVPLSAIKSRECNLNGLSHDDCWSLFSQRAFDNPIQENDPKLVMIGRDIVKMCMGVPLIVKLFAGLLYFQRKASDWELVRGVMRKNVHLDFHLRLCYSHLKPHLKQCFAFCSLFPQGYEIAKGTLIQLWMANGLVPSTDGMELEDVGHEIFSELVVRSFFQEIQHPFPNVTTFEVHYLLHHLARKAMDNDCTNCQESYSLMNSWGARHISFSSSSLKFAMLSPCSQILRTFILLPLHLEFPHLYSDVRSLSGAMISFKVLRVLDLRGWKEESLPMQIYRLKLLRYLDLSYASIVYLPATVSTLVNLQTLKLYECRSLRQLPEDMKNMINLRYLDIRGCNLLTHIPPKIGQLRCLQVLSFFIVGNKTSECSDMEELQCLELRGSLHIRHLERVKDPADAQRANLLGKPNLGELHLCWRDYIEGKEEIDDDKATFGVNTETEVLESLQPHQKLEKLWIIDYMGIHFPSWLMGSELQNLVEIRLYGCKRCEYLPPLGQLPLLKVLRFENLLDVEYIDNEFYGNDLSEGFPSLQTLQIRFMPNLEAWLELQGKEAFLRLSKLEVAFCSKLTTMPCFPSIKDLFLDETDSMLLSSVADCTSLASLKIHSISRLTSFPVGLLQNLTSLRSLTISHCENLAHLPVQLQRLTSLERFSLSHCARIVSLPKEGIQGLVSLEELKIEHCKNLTDLSNGLQHLTTLRMLHVNWCDKLEYLPDGLQYLTNLRHLHLFYCHGLKTLPEGIGNLSSLEVLALGSPKLTSLPHAIKNLSSLQVLKIGSLSLTSLPKGLQQLTTLRELFIGSCPRLASLPEWLENLKSLESLYIKSCPKMTSLPVGLQCLTSLRRLLIIKCPNLNERCKTTGRDWHKIRHIPSFVIE